MRTAFGSLARNQICGVDQYGRGTYTAEGINELCEALKSATTLTSLKYASQLESLPTVNSPASAPRISASSQGHLKSDILGLWFLS